MVHIRKNKGAVGSAATERKNLMADFTCVYPACQNSPRTRGLCHPHYQTMRSYVRAGKATEADLAKRGLLLHKNAAGASSPIFGSEAFLVDSTVRGNAPKYKKIRAK